MTTSNDLLEERAERGEPRGAVAVWRQAHASLRAEATAWPQADAPVAPESDLPTNDDPSGVNPRWFRFALAAAAVVATMLAFGTVLRSQPVTTTEPLADQDPSESDEPAWSEFSVADSVKPPPILMGDTNGKTFELTGVRTVGKVADDEGANTKLAQRIQVFAHPTNPFDHTIVVIGIGEKGQETSILNWSDARYSPVGQAISNQDGRWVVDPGLGLVEVASFDTDPRFISKPGWELTFEEERLGFPERLGTRAELTVTPGDGDNIWPVVVRLVRSIEASNSSLKKLNEWNKRQTTEVFGQKAIVVDDSVLWIKDNAVFEFRVFAYNDRTITENLRPTDYLEALEIADQATWDDRVIGLESPPFSERALDGFFSLIYSVLGSGYLFLLPIAIAIWASIDNSKKKKGQLEVAQAPEPPPKPS